jgi:hypothetical protein
MGLSLFFKHLTPDQVVFLAGVAPAAGMGVLAAVQVMFPGSQKVVAAVENAVAATAPAQPEPPKAA